MPEYRVTKYDPAMRSDSGAFTGDDWTAISDIGRSFDGVTFTKEAYQTVEDAYVSTALLFIEESGGKDLSVQCLENPLERALDYHEGSVLSGESLAQVVRDLLTERTWCRLHDAEGRFIHVGYDYYMYVGVPTLCVQAEAHAKSVGLFVEPFESPYKDEDG